MKIPRLLTGQIIDKITGSNKVIVIYGARQTGKTTLAHEIISRLQYKSLLINADQKKFLDVLSTRDADKINSLVGGNELLFIDEAQRLPEAGLTLKIIHDEMPDLKVIVTGSSSIDLASKISEPLTGRKIVYRLFPVSCQEMMTIQTQFEFNENLENLLIYGSYPEIIQTKAGQDKQLYLEEIGNSYLFKDVFELLNLRNRDKLYDLLRLLAFQTGSEVSLNELSNSLRMNRETVENYLTVLEDTFILFRLKGFSRNLRKEVSKMNKYYFYDLGIRNYMINNFSPLSRRNDQGQLWENFMIIERKKYLSYSGKSVNTFFWRTYTGAELDYVEETDGELSGYEFKWNRKQPKPPQTWTDTYAASFKCFTRENYLSFIAGL